MSNFCWGEIRLGVWGQVQVLSGRVCEPFRVSVSYLCDAPFVTFTDTQRCKAQKERYTVNLSACMCFFNLFISQFSVSVYQYFGLILIIICGCLCFFSLFFCVLIYFRLFISDFFFFQCLFMPRFVIPVAQDSLYITNVYEALTLPETFLSHPHFRSPIS